MAWGAGGRRQGGASGAQRCEIGGGEAGPGLLHSDSDREGSRAPCLAALPAREGVSAEGAARRRGRGRPPGLLGVRDRRHRRREGPGAIAEGALPSPKMAPRPPRRLFHVMPERRGRGGGGRAGGQGWGGEAPLPAEGRCGPRGEGSGVKRRGCARLLKEGRWARGRAEGRPQRAGGHSKYGGGGRPPAPAPAHLRRAEAVPQSS